MRVLQKGQGKIELNIKIKDTNFISQHSLHEGQDTFVSNNTSHLVHPLVLLELRNLAISV